MRKWRRGDWEESEKPAMYCPCPRKLMEKAQLKVKDTSETLNSETTVNNHRRLTGIKIIYKGFLFVFFLIEA